MNTNIKIVRVLCEGSPKRIESVHVDERLAQITVSLTWKRNHSPEHLMLLMFWDKNRMGNPSLFDIRRNALNANQVRSWTVGEASFDLRSDSFECDGEFKLFNGFYSQTIGPQRTFVQIELASNSNPDIACYAQLAYNGNYLSIRPSMISLLESLKVPPVSDWIPE